jgi:hypothetical protein
VNNADQVAADLNRLIEDVVERVILVRLGARAIAIIRQRTLKGEFLEGSSPGASQYSTTPMPLPLGALQKATRGRLQAQEKNQSAYKIFTAKSGRVWVVLQGGYKEFRQLAGKANDHVTMTWSGRMMRNLGIVKRTKSEVEIGFSDQQSHQLAVYHNIMGAGRGRKKHVFMGFTPAEEQELGLGAEVGLVAALGKWGF